MDVVLPCRRLLSLWLLTASATLPGIGLAADPFTSLIADDDGPSLTIVSPEEGDTFVAGEQVVVTYRASLGGKGEYVRVEVDGEPQRVVPAKERGGEQRIGSLGPGRHQITLRLVNRAHADVGAASSVAIRVAASGEQPAVR